MSIPLNSEDKPYRTKLIAMLDDNLTWIPINGNIGYTTCEAERYVRSLVKKWIVEQKARYWHYTIGHDKTNASIADTLVLSRWEIYTGIKGSFEEAIIFYYKPLDHYLTLKKYRGDESAQYYLDQTNKRQAAIDALSEVIN